MRYQGSVIADILSEDLLNRVSTIERKYLAMEKAMHGDTQKQFTTAEMISKLLELAQRVREAKQHGQDLG